MKYRLFTLLIYLLLTASCADNSSIPVFADNEQDPLNTTITIGPEAPTPNETSPSPVIIGQESPAPAETSPPPKAPTDYLFPRHVELARERVNTDYPHFFIAMTDLENKDGYRYIEDSTGAHPASTIKFFIMEYAYLKVASGKADLDISLNGHTLKDRIDLMVQDSCNDSAFSIINYLGRVNIDNYLQENYKKTRLHYSFNPADPGTQFNSSLLEDYIKLLEKIYDNRYTEPYKSMLEVMFGTNTREKIPEATADIPFVKVANKGGSFHDGAVAVDNDVAIVIKEDENGEIEFAYALVILTRSQTRYSTFSTARPSIIAIAREVFELVSEYEYNLNFKGEGT